MQFLRLSGRASSGRARKPPSGRRLVSTQMPTCSATSQTRSKLDAIILIIILLKRVPTRQMGRPIIAIVQYQDDRQRTPRSSKPSLCGQRIDQQGKALGCVSTGTATIGCQTDRLAPTLIERPDSPLLKNMLNRVALAKARTVVDTSPPYYSVPRREGLETCRTEICYSDGKVRSFG